MLEQQMAECWEWSCWCQECLQWQYQVSMCRRTQRVLQSCQIMPYDVMQTFCVWGSHKWTWWVRGLLNFQFASQLYGGIFLHCEEMYILSGSQHRSSQSPWEPGKVWSIGPWPYDQQEWPMVIARYLVVCLTGGKILREMSIRLHYAKEWCDVVVQGQRLPHCSIGGLTW